MLIPGTELLTTKQMGSRYTCSYQRDVHVNTVAPALVLANCVCVLPSVSFVLLFVCVFSPQEDAVCNQHLWHEADTREACHLAESQFCQVHVCVHVCVFVCACVCVCMCACVSVGGCGCECAYTHACVQVCLCVSIHGNVHPRGNTWYNHSDEKQSIDTNVTGRQSPAGIVSSCE